MLFALLILSLLTVVMIVVAAGVMFDFLPAWAPQQGSSRFGDWSSVNRLLPIGSSIVGTVFVTSIFRRYALKGGIHLLVWGIGLAFFATGSITESLHGMLGWHDLTFRFWYLFGAVLIAAWMGQGTVHLLAPAKPARVLSVVLIIASVYATSAVMTADLEPRLLASAVENVQASQGFDEDEVLTHAAALAGQTALDGDGVPDRRRLTPFTRTLGEAARTAGTTSALAGPVPAATLSEPAQGIDLAGDVGGRPVLIGDADWLEGHGIATSTQELSDGPWAVLVAIDGRVAGRIELREPIVFSGHVITSSGVRSLTPFFNIYGIITLIGGAIYSAWVFWRKRIMAHRAVGNVLIAGAAILGGGGSAFARFGMLTHLYLVEFTSLIMMFVGFRFATRSAAPPASAPAVPSSSSDCSPGE